MCWALSICGLSSGIEIPTCLSNYSLAWTFCSLAAYIEYVWGPKCPDHLRCVLVTLGRGPTHSLFSCQILSPGLESGGQEVLLSDQPPPATLDLGHAELSLQMYLETLKRSFVLMESEYVQGLQPGALLPSPEPAPFTLCLPRNSH